MIGLVIWLRTVHVERRRWVFCRPARNLPYFPDEGGLMLANSNRWPSCSLLAAFAWCGLVLRPGAPIALTLQLKGDRLTNWFFIGSGPHGRHVH